MWKKILSFISVHGGAPFLYITVMIKATADCRNVHSKCLLWIRIWELLLSMRKIVETGEIEIYTTTGWYLEAKAEMVTSSNKAVLYVPFLLYPRQIYRYAVFLLLVSLWMKNDVQVMHKKKEQFRTLWDSIPRSLWNYNRDFAFFVFERTKHQPRRNLRSYLVLQRLCNEAALSPGIDAFWY